MHCLVGECAIYCAKGLIGVLSVPIYLANNCVTCDMKEGIVEHLSESCILLLFLSTCPGPASCQGVTYLVQILRCTCCTPSCM